MGKIVVSENVTLDGVVQDPTGEEGFRFGGWFGRITEKDREAFAEVLYAEALAAEALLLGGRSYQWFTERWAARPGEWADRLRSLPKYVVSATVEDLGWGNTTVLPVDEVAKLKDNVDGDIVVYASGRLVHTLMERGLVDELRLMVCPVVLGAGERLFAGTTGGTPLRRIGTRTVGDSLALLTYGW
jgi:dihydrofolate reductase